jgi:hypothetical protein
LRYDIQNIRENKGDQRRDVVPRDENQRGGTG